MGSIIKKKIKGISYYYYVESKRIDGKPKIVNQKCLGNAEKMLASAVFIDSMQQKALYSHEQDFGAVTLIYDIAQRLGIVDIINKHSAKRNQGASVGEYILTEAINRVVAPTTTVKLQDWYQSTCLPRLTGHAPKTFTAQNFWNNTEITAETIQHIEDDILKVIAKEYDIDLSNIIYDATNFFTYIDTMQDSELAQRGHSKEKHNDLRIVGLSLIVSPDFAIPLLHETYPGNSNDSKQFARMMSSLKERYEGITGKNTNVTVVFDRGNNSEDNISFLEDGDFRLHYVGGLKRNQCESLFCVPLSDYRELNENDFPEHKAYRSEFNVFGKNVIALVVYNPALKKGQLQGININIEKTNAKLLDVQNRLLLRSRGEITKGKKPTVESVDAKVKKILKTEYMDTVFTYEIFEKDGCPLLTFAKSEEALTALADKELGKTVLFTDRDDFSDEDIINAYRSVWHVESSFKQMKDTDHLTVRPIFHWKDERIRVHIFTCVLAYRLCCLLRKELSDKGINISINKMIDEIAKVKSVTTFFDVAGKTKKVETFTKGSELSECIIEAFSLKEKYS